jgi:hypothetical protein
MLNTCKSNAWSRFAGAMSGARVSSAWEPALEWGITEGNLG